MKRILTVLVVGASLVGCATITRGTNEVMIIESDPVGAKVEMSNGMGCTTPCSLKMPRKSEFDVTISKDGYETIKTHVGNQVAGGGAAGMAGNVLLGGIIGAGVDAASGSMLELIPNPLTVKMAPVGNAGIAPENQDEKATEEADAGDGAASDPSA